MKGHIENQDFMFTSAFENAKRNQIETEALVNSIEANKKLLLTSDTMLEISSLARQKIREQIDL